MSPALLPPPAWLQHALFDPVRTLMEPSGFELPADLDELNALVRLHAPELRTRAGLPVRFGPQLSSEVGYEAHIDATGEVPTRPQNWHDYFNALAWCVWPRSKAMCNALHLRAIAAREAANLPGRGRQRDAMTQFDECGVLVITSEPAIAGALADHAWHEAFWTRRPQLAGTTRFMMLGHASWDQLRAPFFGLCAKALYRVVSPAWFDLTPEVQQTEADEWLATEFERRGDLLDPRDFSPLPLMGVPGVTPDNKQEAYYADTRQFRPARRTARQTPEALGLT